MSASDALVMSAAVDDGKNSPTDPAHNAEAGQVKFTKDNESIDVNAEQKLIGLTKEQLERYRNDPFWKPIRYTLFALFWLIWIGMFVGAILIVVLSPRCAAKKDKEWHQNTVAYQLFTPTFRDSDADGVGDFNGIKEKLNDLRRVGVSTIWPTPLLKTNKNDFKVAEVVDANAVDERFGSEEELRSLIDRAHDLNLHFIADLPLTISKDNPSASQFGVGTGTVRLLNLANPTVWASVKSTAQKLIKLGVDGLSFAQYGLKYQAALANKLDDLAGEIRNENAKHFYSGNPASFIFIAEAASERPARSINYYSRSLARFSAQTAGASVCSPTSDLLTCLKESAQSGVAEIQKNATTQPIWQLGDITHARVDSLLTNTSESETLAASSLISAIQLFLPGAVKVFYGEELGIPSVKQGADSQFAVMPWDEEGGFSSSTGKLFFQNISEAQSKVFNFKTQYDNQHSNLKVFKKLAQIRARDEVLTDGDYRVEKINGLHVFARTLVGDDKAYLLVANWPASNDKTTKQFIVDNVAKSFVNGNKVASAELLIDHPINSLNPWQIAADSTVLTLEPYEFALVRVEVTA